MNRQVGPYFQQPSKTVMEERIRQLETTVATLAEALGVLTRALEDGPLAEPGATTVTTAARQAHEMLLTLPRPHH